MARKFMLASISLTMRFIYDERDDHKREFHIKSFDEDTYQITTRGLQKKAVVLTDKKGKKKSKEKKDAGIIQAPIPGVVMNVNVSVGDKVEANQVLIVLESMKMLMEFRAPFEAVIESVKVAKGQHVEKGNEMVRLISQNIS